MSLQHEFIPLAVSLVAGCTWYLLAKLRLEIERPRGARLEEYQAGLQPFSGVWELQVATDRQHELAIVERARYQAVGIVLILLPSSAILAGAFSQSSATHHANSELLAETLTIAVVALLVLGFREPTRAWARARMRCELLRLHTHLRLAALPPYGDAANSPSPSQIISDAERADTPTLRQHLEAIVYALTTDDGSLTTEPIDGERASAYERERIREQVRWFAKATAAVQWQLRLSSWLFKGSLVVALVASTTQLFGSLLAAPDSLIAASGTVVRICVGLVMLALTARALQGWESRLSVYEPMSHDVTSWAKAYEKLKTDAWGDVHDPNWQREFRDLSRSIEVAMSKEALQWLVAIQRELYEAPI